MQGGTTSADHSTNTTTATQATAVSDPAPSPDAHGGTTASFTYHEPYYLVHSDGPGVGILIFAGIFGGVIAIFTIVTIYPCTDGSARTGDRQQLLSSTKIVL